MKQSDLGKSLDPTLRLASVSSPPQQRQGYTLAGRRGGSIFWKTTDIGLPSYSNNLSTPYCLACSDMISCELQSTSRASIKYCCCSQSYVIIQIMYGESGKLPSQPMPSLLCETIYLYHSHSFPEEAVNWQSRIPR